MLITALAMVLIISMAGLALDLSKLFITKSQLQNAADACALAAAQKLDGTSQQFTLAEQAGIVAGTAAGNSKTSFVSSNISIIRDSSIQFSKSINESSINASTGAALNNANASTYDTVSCNLNESNIPNWFTNVFARINNQATSNVSATAYASLVPAQSGCGLPIAICNSASGLGSVGSLLKGQLNKSNSNSTFSTNSYQFDTSSSDRDLRWIHYGNGTGSATELNNLLSGADTCNLTSSGQRVIQQPTPNTNLDAFYNGRFGLRKSGVTVSSSPDHTGFAYNSGNSYSNYLLQKAGNVPYQFSVTTPNGYSNSNTNNLVVNGSNRRVGIVPVVNCGNINTGTTAIDWACVMLSNPIVFATNPSSGSPQPGLVTLEYLGQTNKNSPCNQVGFAGAASTNNSQPGFVVPALVR